MSREKCDEDVYQNGTQCLLIGGASGFTGDRLEEICEIVATELKTKIDRHMYAGRYVVKTLGDWNVVRESLLEHILKEFPKLQYME